MKSLIIFFTVLTVMHCSSNAFGENNDLEERHKRDVFEKAQEMGMNMAGRAMEAASQGVSGQDTRQTGFNAFGQQFETGYKVKGGFGDGMNAGFVERQKRSVVDLVRGKRSPCRRGASSTTVIVPPVTTRLPTTVAAG